MNVNNNNPSKIEDLLAGHLDALVSGDRTESFIEEADSEALELLHLANQLHFALRPVEPSAEFMARIKSEFVSPEPATLVLRWRKLPARYRLAARVGGATLTAGIALLAVRRALSVLSVLRDRHEHEAGAAVNITP